MKHDQISNGNHTITRQIVTGNDLRLARILYGYDSQEVLAAKIGCSLGTVQRYEAMPIIDAKIIGVYEIELKFNLNVIIDFVTRLRMTRDY